MRKLKLVLAAAAVLTALPMLQGCVPAIVTGATVGVMSAYDRRSTGTQADDETAEWKARARVPEQYKKTANVNFTSYNRRLLITGEVPTPEARETIEAQARMVDGIRDVYNELGVGPVSPLGSRSNDSFITSKLKARLVDSNQISANHVKVVTERGIAYLMGIVNEREAKVAVAVARTTAGVLKVVNILEVVDESETRRIDSQMPGARQAPAQTVPVEQR
jgi:osmotically-inducible protein OsmY